MKAKEIRLTLSQLTLTAIMTAIVLPTSALAQESAPSDNAPEQGASEKGSLGKLPIELQQLFPLSPEERKLIREEKQREQEAIYDPLRKVTPIRDFQRIGTAGDQMPTIHVTPDYPSSVVFTDLTGEPWPIQHISQTGALASVEQPSGTDNVIVLHAAIAAGQKSISVFLEGNTLPVTLIIDGSNNRYHALKHIRIDERGPNAAQITQTSQVQSSSSRFQQESSTGESLDVVLNKLAYRVTPDGYSKLQVSDRSVDAWVEDENPDVMYLMTEYTIISPAPIGGAEAITPIQDNLRIYRIPRIDPVMALNESGQRIYLSFKE